jgi:beta-galactosidase
VHAVDARGRTVPNADIAVRFRLTGPGRIIGVGNGNPSSHEADKAFGTTQVFALGEWTAPDAAPSPGGIEYVALFDRPQTSAEDGLLLLNALGPRQTVTLNGRALYRAAEPATARVSIPLRLAELKPSGNRLEFSAQKFESWGERENLARFHPASLRVDVPAAAWQRETFNGLAQVIVETDGTPGELVLVAEPAHLAPTNLVLEVQ